MLYNLETQKAKVFDPCQQSQPILSEESYEATYD